MRVVLVGADFEENLGMAMIAAALHAAGHKVHVVPFNDVSQTDVVTRAVCEWAPDVVGLSMQFQHRGHEFLRLASQLRSQGYRGHVTCGGQFPTLAWREVLEHHRALDSIVLHDGEETVVELLDALRTGAPLASVAGLALRGPKSQAFRTRGRALCADLDSLPVARRYRPHTLHVGVPFIPISGSRGCWGSCSYCSITSFYRDARAHGGGMTFRLRSPQSVAREMACLWHAAGGPSIFCFHDDNFLLPRPADSLARVEAIRCGLDARGVGKVGIIGKCRPECLTKELAGSLRKLGVVRLYVGVENASQAGADHLSRKTQTASVRAALAALREAGIFGCYNLLVFEPHATLADVRDNIAFIREHASHPVNFCRAEPYHGTPLHRSQAGTGHLGGSYLGWDYRIEDDRAELLFRICAAAFRERNFASAGVANRYMGLGYHAKLLEHFYEDPAGRRARIRRRVDEVTRGVSLETADLLEEAVGIAERYDPADRDATERETVLLGLKVSALDNAWHRELDELMDEMQAFASDSGGRRARRRGVRELVQGITVAGMLAVGGVGCGGKSVVADPVPSDAGVDAETDGGGTDAGLDGMVDPAPLDAGYDGMSDPLPWDGGFDGMADPPPWDAGFDGMADPAPYDSAIDPKLIIQEHWRDTSPRRAARTGDLPLNDPPELKLAARRFDGAIEVVVGDSVEPRSLKVECDGQLVVDGARVSWVPSSDDDQLRVAVRTRGGVAVATVRAREV